MAFALEATVINAMDMDYALQQSSYNWKKASIQYPLHEDYVQELAI